MPQVSGVADTLFEQNPTQYQRLLLPDTNGNLGLVLRDPVTMAAIAKLPEKSHGMTIRVGHFVRAECRGMQIRPEEITSINGETPSTDQTNPWEDLPTMGFPTEPIPITESEGTPRELFMLRWLDLIVKLGFGMKCGIVGETGSGKSTILNLLTRTIGLSVDYVICVSLERPEDLVAMIAAVGLTPEYWGRTTDQGDRIPNGPQLETAEERAYFASYVAVHKAELAIARAARLAEQGRDILVVVDSFTQLAWRYNRLFHSGKTQSGGLDPITWDALNQYAGYAKYSRKGSVSIMFSLLLSLDADRQVRSQVESMSSVMIPTLPRNIWYVDKTRPEVAGPVIDVLASYTRGPLGMDQLARERILDLTTEPDPKSPNGMGRRQKRLAPSIIYDTLKEESSNEALLARWEAENKPPADDEPKTEATAPEPAPLPPTVSTINSDKAEEMWRQAAKAVAAEEAARPKTDGGLQ